MITADENYLLTLIEEVDEDNIIKTVILNSNFMKGEIRGVLRTGRFQFRNQNEIDEALKEGKYIDQPMIFTFKSAGRIVCNPVSFCGTHWISHPVSAKGLTIKVNPNATFEVVKKVR